ncbi:MAG: DegT/DnrJ/EryC1/StrS family aminotransferase [Thermodesulfovibrionales bacterium]|nr:DegT/DnrJ/EryC1/StrS family aminotransferase [Thermodesulfovibrionales bacterium]
MIPMIDLKKNYLTIKDEIHQGIGQVLESGQFILGKKGLELEEKVKDFLKVPNALSLASGTDSLHLALRALGIGRDDEVITTPFTFFATVEAILYVGAKPVFVDIDKDTFNIDPTLITKKISKKTKAILPVHIFGHPADMPTIMEIANEHNLKVIEDCAQSFGASIGNQMTGTFGDAGCFSFYPSKNLGAYGDGGMVVFKDSALSNEIKRLRNHGSLGNYVHDIIGINSRLDELQAVVLLVKLERIRQYNENRRDCARFYSEFLKDTSVVCPIERDGYYHVYHQFSIRHKDRDVIQQNLKDNGIASVVYYPIPLHLQRALEFLGYKRGDFPVAEMVSSEILSLPMYPELTSQEIQTICKTIQKSL